MIARLIKQRTNCKPPTPATVQAFLLQACEEEKDTVYDAVAEHLNHQDHKLGPAGANKKTRSLLNPQWQDQKLPLVSGKALVARLNTWAQQHYQTSVGAMAIAKAFQHSEIPTEMRGIITSIEEGTGSPGFLTTDRT